MTVPVASRVSPQLIDESLIIRALGCTRLAPLSDPLIKKSKQILAIRSHGDRDKWIRAVAKLPDIKNSHISLNTDAVTTSCDLEVSVDNMEVIRSCCLELCPWRKGPFNLFGMEIDAEWRSNLKWSRIAQQISSLENRLVLDVGSGNGYYLFRMLGQGASLVVGIDPTQLFLAQFAAINRYAESSKGFILPLRSEEMLVPEKEFSVLGFDTVFSMGIYYHRRNGIDHLRELYSFLRPGGELVLETLVIDGDGEQELIPQGRYAQMRNVWCIPTVLTLKKQMAQMGFENISLVDQTVTTTQEQRCTEWMQFDSLSSFLDPAEKTKTIEGHPAPLRATLVATKSQS